jgi:hypothetical protein
MSERKLKDWLSGFMQFTDNLETPKLYRLWCGVSAIAAALQRKVLVDWGQHVFYPNMYIVLVGPGAVGKGTAMRPAKELLKRMGGVRMSSQATTKEALVLRLKEANYHHQDPVTGLSTFHSSMTIFAEELTVFIGYQQRELMAYLCDWFDCEGQWTYDTKNKGTDEIMGVWVNLIGATTPQLIMSSLPLESIGGGLTSRIIFVYADKAETISPFPFLSEEKLELREHLQADLERIHLLCGKFTITADYLDAWGTWYCAQAANPPKHLLGEHFGSYLGRRRVHLMKLAMIICASESDEMIMRESHLSTAEQLLSMTEIHMPQVFAGVGKNPVSDMVPKLLLFIRRTGVVSMSDLTRHFYRDADGQTLDRLIKTLEMMQAIKVVHKDGQILIEYNAACINPVLQP